MFFSHSRRGFSIQVKWIPSTVLSLKIEGNKNSVGDYDLINVFTVLVALPEKDEYWGLMGRLSGGLKVLLIKDTFVFELYKPQVLVGIQTMMLSYTHTHRDYK